MELDKKAGPQQRSLSPYIYHGAISLILFFFCINHSFIKKKKLLKCSSGDGAIPLK
jgi:hypothetical protein